MTINTSETTRQSVRLPTIKLRPWKLMADGEEHDSISGLAHYLAVQCITSLIDVVRQADPLSEPELTSAIWLRTNGDIELIRETNHKQRSIGDLVADSLHIDVFRSKQDAVPFSSYHRWIADPHGEYVGDMVGRKHCLRPGWDKATSIANTDLYKTAVEAIEWTRLRIEPLSTEEVIQHLKKCGYREKLRARIMKWIIEGRYVSTLQKLSLIGLRRAAEDHGMDFILRYGRNDYYRAVSEKVYRAIAEGGVQKDKGFMKNNMPLYLVIGPDEIPIRQAPFDSKSAAQKAITAFAERFTQQGYYRDANGVAIEVADIPSRCRIERV